MVDGRARGNGRREYFQDITQAKTRAEQLEFNRANNGIAALKAPIRDLVMAEDARAILAPFRKTILDAAKFYVAHLTQEIERSTAPKINNVVTDFIASRERDVQRGDVSAETVADLRNVTRHLRAAAGDIPINRFGAEQLRTFLDSFPVSDRRRFNLRLRLSGLFSFAKRKGYIQQNPCEQVLVKFRRKDIAVLTVDQAEALLRATEKSEHRDVLVPWAVISLFAGLRPFECRRLEWKDVDLESSHIFVRAETSKKRESRYVEINETLRRWLLLYAKSSGPVCGANFRKQFDSIKDAIGRPWVQDILRHTAVSMLLALRSDRAYVCEQVGTSPGVLKTAYRQPILPTTARRFFALSPDTAPLGIA